MLFSVGYQMRNDDNFLKEIISAKNSIYEIYFSWGDFANGRNKITDSGLSPEYAISRQEEDLLELNSEGFSFNLLLNGNCYGEESLARSLYEKIGDTVLMLCENINLKSVTTTSPIIAKFIKENFPHLKTRASVNMNIGETSGMDYIADIFDGYYMKREHNRNINKIKELSGWCTENGKELFFLANSGCLNHCSTHTFHDNLVSHESEIMKKDNAYSFTGICKTYFENPEKKKTLVQNSNFIRPEDIYLLEGYFTAAKLATRVSARPEQILKAYVSGEYHGNPLGLLEPDHTHTFYPDYIDNKKIPDDFMKNVLNCNKNCVCCKYCENVYNQATVVLRNIY